MYTESGVISFPSHAAADKGKAVLASLVEDFAARARGVSPEAAAGAVFRRPRAMCGPDWPVSTEEAPPRQVIAGAVGSTPAAAKTRPPRAWVLPLPDRGEPLPCRLRRSVRQRARRSNGPAWQRSRQRPAGAQDLSDHLGQGAQRRGRRHQTFALQRGDHICDHRVGWSPPRIGYLRQNPVHLLGCQAHLRLDKCIRVHGLDVPWRQLVYGEVPQVERDYDLRLRPDVAART